MAMDENQDLDIAKIEGRGVFILNKSDTNVENAPTIFEMQSFFDFFEFN